VGEPKSAKLAGFELEAALTRALALDAARTLSRAAARAFDEPPAPPAEALSRVLDEVMPVASARQTGTVLRRRRPSVMNE
jgi:hypothetical protein